jgi:hypothetical protein
MRRPILKILYVEPDIDEKSGSAILENSTATLQNIICVFTVVSNCFLALEATEHTSFDLIFVRKDLPNLCASQFHNILSCVGSHIPIILMNEALKTNQPTKSSNDTLHMNLFAAVLETPYSNIALCRLISFLMSPNDISDEMMTLPSISVSSSSTGISSSYSSSSSSSTTSLSSSDYESKRDVSHGMYSNHLKRKRATSIDDDNDSLSTDNSSEVIEYSKVKFSNDKDSLENIYQDIFGREKLQNNKNNNNNEARVSENNSFLDAFLDEPAHPFYSSFK